MDAAGTIGPPAEGAAVPEHLPSSVRPRDQGEGPGGAGPPGATEPDRAARRRIAEVALIALMALASLVLWLGIPALWLWAVSQVSDAYLTIYVVALLGCPVTMALWGLVIARINRVYLDVSGSQGGGARRSPWLKSMSAERGGGEPRPVLDVVMAASVVAALLTMAVWFVFFAGSPLPH